MTAVAVLRRVRESARFIAPNLVPVGLHRALTTRRALRERGFDTRSLKAAFEVTAENVHLIPADIDLNQALVVDLGANEGRWTAALLAVAPRARIIAVEPAPAMRALLDQRFGGLPNVRVVGKAVGAEPGPRR